MTTTPTTPTMRDLLRSRGTELATKRTDDALDALCDASSRVTDLVDNGKIPTNFVTGLAEWMERVAADVEMGQPIPPLGSTGNAPKLKPELERLVRAYDRGEFEIDSTTGLPKAADDGAEVDNTISHVEKAVGSGKVDGDDAPTRLRRVVANIKALRDSSDKLGEVAEKLGLAKDAKPDDVVAAAKESKDMTGALSDIAAELGLAKDAKTSAIVAAVKAAKAGVPTPSGSGRWSRGRGGTR